jgi:hypothetical protein
MRMGGIAMIAITDAHGTLVGSYCQQEFEACPGDPWSAVVIKPPGAAEIEQGAN